MGYSSAPRLINALGGDAKTTTKVCQSLKKAGFGSEAIADMAERLGREGTLKLERLASGGLSGDILEALARNEDLLGRYSADTLLSFKGTACAADTVIDFLRQTDVDGASLYRIYGDKAVDIWKTMDKKGLESLWNYGDEFLEQYQRRGSEFVQDFLENGDAALRGGLNALDTQTIRNIQEIIVEKGLTKKDFLQLMIKSSDELTQNEAKIMEDIRNSVPFPDETTPLQKVINPAYIDSYLDGSFVNFNDGKISGCITTVEDVAGLTNPQFLYEGLRLDYKNTPFSPKDSSVTVIRFTSNNTDNIVVPYGDGMPNPTGGNVSTMTPPFTGNGFTAATNGQIIPEFYSEGLNINNGAQMIEITDEGEEILKAVYDEDLQRFILVD